MNPMSRTMNRNFLKAGLIATTLLSMSGCVGYNVYPPETGTAGFTNPNSVPMYDIMTVAVKWAVKKYPPGDQSFPTAADIPISEAEANAIAALPGGAGGAPRVAVSLFSTMRPEVYTYAVQQIGQGAVPLTPESEHLPRYMVSRIQVRGDQAKVDVFRPVASIGGASTDPSGAKLYQPITVNLRGGTSFWRVTSYRVWSIGTFAAPAPEYLPGSVPMTVEPPHEPMTEPAGEPVDLIEPAPSSGAGVPDTHE